MASKATFDLIINALTKFGITNPLVQTAVLSSIQSETNFVPRNEKGYGNTPVSRIREIFGSRVRNYTDAQLEALKKDDVKFFDVVYGHLSELGRNNGNTLPGDGYKYRGRGFNQITFKNNYRVFGNRIGIDLVSNPDRLNELPVAALAAAAFYADGLASAARSGLMQRKYGIANASEAKDRDTAVKIVLNTNAGWGNDITKGFLATILEKQKQGFDKLVGIAKTNPGASAITGILIFTGLFFLGYKIYQSNQA
jgi:predicted chitinase